MPQMNVEGVVISCWNDGASSSAPLLRMATPLLVPFSKSSKEDCSQVLVPWAMANVESSRSENSFFMGKSELMIVDFRLKSSGRRRSAERQYSCPQSTIKNRKPKLTSRSP